MRPGVRPAVIGAFLLLAVVLGTHTTSLATTFPIGSGFSQDVVAEGLTDPTAFAFFPDGRILIAEKAGIVRIVKDGVLLPTPFIDVSDRVNDYWDRGLLGIAVDPSFPHVYLLYTYENDPVDYVGRKTARLTRVDVSGDTADPASETIILGTVFGTTTIRSCNGFPAGSDCIPQDGTSHAVGNVKFASDGTIFVTIGDGAEYSIVNDDALRALDLDSLAGKLLRITRTGQGLPTNPHWNGSANANRSKVWARGLRNAYRFNLRPGSDMPYLGDVGWNDREEINVATAGANLGWPCFEGSGIQAGYASYPLCQALYVASGTPGSLASSGTIIARVVAPQGSGAPLPVIRDGDKPPVGNGETFRQYDSYVGGAPASADWVGYTFPAAHTFNRVVFQEGMHFWDGGWFAGPPTVQVRQGVSWVTVSSLVITPAYAGNNGASYETYTMTFTPIQGDGIRIHGVPGGNGFFISVGELEVFEETTGGGGGGGGGGPTEVNVSGQAQTVIARVPAPLGTGGGLGVVRDGDKPPVGNGESLRQYDSWDGENFASEDWVGYTFAVPQTFARVVFQEGLHFWDGGWFAGPPTVQVRQGVSWVTVSSLVITPAYAGNNGASYETYTMTFTPIQGDGIRIHGVPGGNGFFISIGELEAFALVEGGGPTETVTPPFYEYFHLSQGAAVTAGAFYSGTVYPAQYQGAYFFADFALDWIRTLRADSNDVMVPGSLEDFAEEADGPVSLEMGPDGFLYYLAISANELRRIRHTAGSTPPTAVASAIPTSGLAPLTVNFDSAGSNDPDDDPLTFEWDFGDGSPLDDNPSPQHTYTVNGTYVATLTVRDNQGGVGTDTVTITVGNLPPVATINTPAATLLFKVGDVISYSGSASNSPGDGIPGATLTWQVVLHHCPGGSCHDHPVGSGSGPGGSFTVENHGDDSYFEIILTATDPGGLWHTVSRTIQPQTVQMTLATVPSGLQVVYDGTAGTAPYVRTTIAGSTHTIFAPSPQGASTFASWSDGGAQSHNVTVGTTNMTRTATFGGNLPPVATISTPAATLTFKVGDVVSYSGSATSPPGDTVPGATLTWQIKLTHCPGGICQTQVHASSTGPSGTFTVPNHGDGSSFEIILTATDSGGLAHTVSRVIQPQTVQVTLATNPTGLQVTYDGITGTAPFVRTAVVGATRTINAPSPQGTSGFATWSDGGAQQHNVTVGTANVTYTASYSIVCPVGQFRAQYYNNLTLSGNPVLTRCEAYPLNYNWGNGGPGSGVNTNNFSARWQGRFDFTGGSYTFTTQSDDGVRLWVDSVQLINFWTDHAPTTRTATQTVAAGEHEVRVEYYEKTGGAVLQVSWAGGGSGEANVAAQAQTVIARVTAPTGTGGGLSVIRDGDKPPVGNGDTTRQFDSYDGSNAASEDWVGYTFATARTFTRVVFQEGIHFWDGGWFTASPIVQVRQGASWVTVSNLVTTPAYAGNNGTSYETYTMTFTSIQGDGIRIYGVPGGANQFISVGELEVFALP